MALDLGVLLSRIEITGAAEASRALASVRAGFTETGAAAERSAGAVGASERALIGAGRSAGLASAAQSRLRAAQMGALAAQERYNAVLARTGASVERTAAAEAQLRSAQAAAATAQDRLNVLRSGGAASSERIAAAEATLQAAQARVTVAQERQNAVLAGGAASTRELAVAEASLIRANERLAATGAAGAAGLAGTARAAGAAEASVAGFHTRLLRTVETLGKLGLAFGGFELARKGIEFVRAGADLTTALNGVQAAARATNRQMVAVRAESINLGRDLRVPGATAVDAADAIQDLVRAGMRLPRAMEAARPALLLASAAQVDTADAARYLGDTLDDFQLPAREAARVANLLAGAATSAGGGLSEMFTALSYAGPYARSAGVSVDEVVASIAELAKSGIQGSRAGTGIARMLQQLAAPSDKAKGALRDLGIQAWDTQGRFVGFQKLFGQLHGAQERMGVDTERWSRDIATAFGARAATAINVFAHRGAEGFDYFWEHARTGNVQKFADTMNRGFSAAMGQLRKVFTDAGITIYQSIEPGLARVAMWLGRTIPQAAAALGHAFGPVLGLLGAGWRVLEGPIRATGDALGFVTRTMRVASPVAKGLAVATAGMFTAWAGYRVVSAAANVIRLAFTRVSTLASNAASGFGRYRAGVSGAFRGAAADAALAARIQQAEFASIEAAAMREAAVVDRAAAQVASAKLAEARATGTASAEEVAGYEAAAVAAEAQARTSQLAAEQTAAAATTTAAEVTTASEAAGSMSLGSMLGPIGLVVGGLAAVGFGFLHSGRDAEAAAESVQSYTQAIEEDNGALGKHLRSQVEDTLVKQGVYDAALKAGIGQKYLTDQVLAGGAGLDKVKQKLREFALGSQNSFNQYGASGQLVGKHFSAVAKQVLAAVVALDTEGGAVQTSAHAARNKAAAEGEDTSATGKNTAEQRRNAAAQKAAQAAANQHKAAVQALSDSLRAATVTGTAFAQAVQTYQDSSHGVADRAALIGQTLLSANGDALSFAASMNAAATASRQFRTDVRQAAQGAGESTRSYLRSVVNLRTGTINYRSAAAGPMISSLQAMQTAAQAAAQATFQHARATMSGRDAATAAYHVYQSQTSVALVAQAKQLGLTTAQAQALAKQYFGMPKDVKTLIRQEGADPIVTVLNKIGKLLAYLVGKPWTPKIDANTDSLLSKAAQAQKTVTDIRQGRIPELRINTTQWDNALARALEEQRALHDKTIHITTTYDGIDVGGTRGVGVPHATGGAIRGPGTGTSDSIPAMLSTGEHVLPAAEVKQAGGQDAIFRMRAAIRRGLKFAGGGAAESLMSVIQRAGFHGHAADIMYAIVMAESGGYARAHNTNSGTRDNSYGLAQINMFESLGPERRRRYHLHDNNQLFDPLTNLRIAYDMSGHGHNWSPWTTYTSGAYRQFLSASERARVKGGSGGASSGSSSSAAQRAQAAEQRAVQRANQRRAAAVGNASTAISGVNATPGGSRFQLDTFNDRAFEAQMRHARAAIAAAKAADASSKTLHNLRDRLRDIGEAGRAVERRLRGQVVDSIAKLANAISNPAAGSLASALQQLNGEIRRTGATAGQMDRLERAERRLSGTRTDLLAATNRLTSMRGYETGILQARGQAFDPTVYGSARDLEQGLTGAAGTNRDFRRQIQTLRREGLDKMFLTRLIQAGPSATLETLAGSSRADIAQVNKDLAAWRTSSHLLANTAVTQRFGVGIDQEQRRIDRITARAADEMGNLAHLINRMGDVAGRPITLELNGHVLARDVVHSREMANEFYRLARHLGYGRR